MQPALSGCLWLEGWPLPYLNLGCMSLWLAVGGQGQLVMQKRHPATGLAEGEEEGDDVLAGRDTKGTLEKYSGVKVGSLGTP